MISNKSDPEIDSKAYELTQLENIFKDINLNLQYSSNAEDELLLDISNEFAKLVKDSNDTICGIVRKTQTSSDEFQTYFVGIDYDEVATDIGILETTEKDIINRALYNNSDFNFGGIYPPEQL